MRHKAREGTRLSKAELKLMKCFRHSHDRGGQLEDWLRPGDASLEIFVFPLSGDESDQLKGILGESLKGRTGDLCMLFKLLTLVLIPLAAAFDSNMPGVTMSYFISSSLKSSLADLLLHLRLIIALHSASISP